MVAFAVGAVLALAIGIMATVVGFDRDRAFYPAVTIVVGSYYVLFAAMGASTHTLLLETLVGVAFLAAAVIGFRSSLWLVAVALAAHGVFDLLHGAIIANPGVPAFWPGFCSGYDIVAAGYLMWLLTSRRVPVAPVPAR